MTIEEPAMAPRRGYPAPMSDILAAQDAGYRSWADGPTATCPYRSDSPAEAFLREQWAAGRAHARVDAMDAEGWFTGDPSSREPQQRQGGDEVPENRD